MHCTNNFLLFRKINLNSDKTFPGYTLNFSYQLFAIENQQIFAKCGLFASFYQITK